MMSTLASSVSLTISKPQQTVAWRLRLLVNLWSEVSRISKQCISLWKMLQCNEIHGYSSPWHRRWYLEQCQRMCRWVMSNHQSTVLMKGGHRWVFECLINELYLNAHQVLCPHSLLYLLDLCPSPPLHPSPPPPLHPSPSPPLHCYCKRHYHWHLNHC